MARPSTYSDEIASVICERIADGMSVRAICEAEDMPSKSTVFRWLADHSSFRDQYARAKEAQAEHLADEILDIADDGRNDWMIRTLRGGIEVEVENTEVLSRSRLRVDARKWLLSKMLPKKYGDKLTQEHTGADGGPVETVFRWQSEKS